MVIETVEKALKLKKKFYNFNDLLDYYNVKIKHKDFENIYGYTMYQKNINYILLKENLTEEQEYFVLLHELAHIIFHPKEAREFNNSLTTDRYEIQADIFAVIYGGYRYYDSTDWLNKKINYIIGSHLNSLDFNITIDEYIYEY